MSMIGRVIAAGLLVWALARHRYDYFVLLRWVTCVAAGYSAYLAANQKKLAWTWILGAVAVLFNPLVPIHLRRETWAFIDVGTALLLLGSIAAVREERRDGPTGTTSGSSPKGQVVRTLLWGFVWLAGGVWLWLAEVGNPIDELILIRRAQIAPGFIVDTWEDAESGDEGGTIWFHGAEYAYRLPDGRELSGTTGDRRGRLREDLRVTTKPVPIEVEYDPLNPERSRIKGDGQDTILRWAIFKLGLGGLLLALFVSPGIVILKGGIQELVSLRGRPTG